jgi:hypothetical protein
MDTTDDNAKPRGDVSTDGDLRFAGSVLGAQRHVCAFFHTADEEYRVMLPFIYLVVEPLRKCFWQYTSKES